MTEDRSQKTRTLTALTKTSNANVLHNLVKAISTTCKAAKRSVSAGTVPPVQLHEEVPRVSLFGAVTNELVDI